MEVIKIMYGPYECGTLTLDAKLKLNVNLHPNIRCMLPSTGMSMWRWLKGRVMPPERVNKEATLARIGLTEYNEYDILRKTRGTKFGSLFWLKYEDDTWEWENTPYYKQSHHTPLKEKVLIDT